MLPFGSTLEAGSAPGGVQLVVEQVVVGEGGCLMRVSSRGGTRLSWIVWRST